MCKKQTRLNMIVLLAVVLAMTSSVALANLPPIADAGPNQDMYLGESVMLHGSAIDPDGDPILSWEWEVISAPAGSNYSLALANTTNAVFGTDTPGNYVVTLIASDGLLWSDPDATVVIVVENHSPTALIDATPISGPAPLLVSFDGTNSYDPEGEELAYDWYFYDDFTYGTGATTDHEFQMVGTYEVVLKVTDEFGNIDFDSIEITVTEGGNHPPVADAGENQTMYLGESVMLQGSATDPDGHPIRGWEWQVVSAPTGSNYVLASADTANAQFTTNMVGDYVLNLIVSDGQLWSDPDATVVTVVENHSPTAIIEATPISGPAPLLVSFDGTNSYDPEGEALAFDWNFGDLTYGTGATIDHEFQSVGNYVVVLKVTDKFGNIDFDSIVITVTADISVDIDIKPGSNPNSFNINGSGVIPVAILGSADFDVRDIDPATVSLNGLAVAVRGKDKLMVAYEDVIGPDDGPPDGFVDLVIKFEDDAEKWILGDDVAEFSGNLHDGTPICGWDYINIVP